MPEVKSDALYHAWFRLTGHRQRWRLIGTAASHAGARDLVSRHALEVGALDYDSLVTAGEKDPYGKVVQHGY